MKIVLAIIATLIGLFLAALFTMEEPITVGEANVFKFVPICNLFWFVPYVVYYIVKRRPKYILHCTIIYSVIFIGVLFFKFYRRPFNSEKWKTEFTDSVVVDSFAIHANARMVEDIVESKMLIGLSRSEVLEKLGNHYYLKWEYDEEHLYYRYSSHSMFDGCDKLHITLKNKICVRASYAGCD